LKIKVLSVVQSFPENVVTLSRFRAFVENSRYDYQVFCWKSSPADWAIWAEDIPQKIHEKVLVSGAQMIFQPPFLDEGFRFLRFAVQNSGLSLRYLRYQAPKIGWIRAVHRLLDDYKILQAKPDILHFEFGAIAVGKIYLREFLGCKIVVSFRGFDLNFYQLANDSAYQTVWTKADGFHFLGQDLLNRARKRGFKGQKNIFLIPPAVDLERFRPVPRADSGDIVNIVSVSRLVWKKGLNFGLLAFAEFLKKGGQGCYHLVGDGPSREELLFYAHELGIADKVIFHGKCAPNQVRDILNQADILLHPAVSEGFCNAVLEAQAMQLPVVCFAADGLSENLAPGETGFIAPCWDWPQMARHLYELWANPTLRQQMGEKGRQRVAALFTLEKQTAAFDAMYRGLLAPDPDAVPIP
jgi:colanic acid/amylovoran biosynthesis glycosyltransferase